MKQAVRRSTGPRGPGTYVQKACSVCRQKKTKCDGIKPVCNPCASSGREGECSYGKEASRRPRTEAHFEALLKYLRTLELLLDICSKEHGGSTAFEYKRFRPLDWEDLPDSSPEGVSPELEESNEELPLSESADVAKQLCRPTQNLTLVEEGGPLLLHGATAPFRYISEPKRTHSTRISRISNITGNPNSCYTLMLDGVDRSHYNPNFEWSRHLPADTGFLDRREHDKILDLYFKFSASWCLRIVPPLFLRDMYRSLNSKTQEIVTSHYSPMLHNALIAASSAFSDDPRVRDIQKRQLFVEKAKSYFEQECSRPNLSVVTALSLIATFYSGQGDQTMGYMYFGMSARMSQALGLGVDCTSWIQDKVITEEDQMDRNWVYWTTFCQDVCWSLYVGRDSCIPNVSQRIPIPFVDAEFDKMDWVHLPSGILPQPGYLSKTFQWTTQLLQIARRIMDVVNTLDNPADCNRGISRDQLISGIDVQLCTWHSNLPEEIKDSVRTRITATPHRLQLHLTYQWCFILLHRPFFNRRKGLISSFDKEIDHVKLCKRAADRSMELLETWRKLYTLRYVPITLVQIVFSAGTIYLLSALHATKGVRVGIKELRSSLDNARLCINYLREIGGSWQCATNIGDILMDWLQCQIRPIVERRTMSPSTSGFLPPQVQRTTPRKRPRSTSPGNLSSSRADHVRQRSEFNEVITVAGSSNGNGNENEAVPVRVGPSYETGEELEFSMGPGISMIVEQSEAEQWNDLELERSMLELLGWQMETTAPVGMDGYQQLWAPTERPMSPVNQLAMPNGQPLWNTPFVAFSADDEELGYEMVGRDVDQ